MIIIIDKVYLKKKHVIWNIYVKIIPNTLLSRSSEYENLPI
jgi:hypothetical protein